MFFQILFFMFMFMFIIRRLYSLQGSNTTSTLLYSVSALLFADEETYSYLDSVAVRCGLSRVVTGPIGYT